MLQFNPAILLRRTLRPSIVFSVKTHAIFDALITKTVPLSRVYNVLEHNQRPSLTSSCSQSTGEKKISDQTLKYNIISAVIELNTGCHGDMYESTQPHRRHWAGMSYTLFHKGHFQWKSKFYTSQGNTFQNVRWLLISEPSIIKKEHCHHGYHSLH